MGANGLLKTDGVVADWLWRSKAGEIGELIFGTNYSCMFCAETIKAGWTRSMCHQPCCSFESAAQ